MYLEDEETKSVEEVSLTILNSDIPSQSRQLQTLIVDTVTYLPLGVQQLIFSYVMPASWETFEKIMKSFQKSFTAPFWKSARQDPYFPLIQRFQKKRFIWERIKSSLSMEWYDAFMDVALDIIQDELKACSPRVQIQIMASAYMQIFEPGLVDTTLIYSTHSQHVAIKKKLIQIFYTKHSTMSAFNYATARLKMNDLLKKSIDCYVPILISTTLSQGTTSIADRYGKVSHLEFLRDTEKYTEANACLLALTAVPMFIFFFFGLVFLVASAVPRGDTDEQKEESKAAVLAGAFWCLIIGISLGIIPLRTFYHFLVQDRHKEILNDIEAEFLPIEMEQSAKEWLKRQINPNDLTDETKTLHFRVEKIDIEEKKTDLITLPKDAFILPSAPDKFFSHRILKPNEEVAAGAQSDPFNATVKVVTFKTISDIIEEILDEQITILEKQEEVEIKRSLSGIAKGPKTVLFKAPQEIKSLSDDKEVKRPANLIQNRSKPAFFTSSNDLFKNFGSGHDLMQPLLAEDNLLSESYGNG